MPWRYFRGCPMSDELEDPVTARLLRHRSNLRQGGLASDHEVLATYWATAGIPVFAFCRHGLLLSPGKRERYIPFIEIEDAGYHNREMIERAKGARISGSSQAPLSITLISGEKIELALEGSAGEIPDLLTIAALIHQRVVIHRADVARSNRDPML